MQKPAELWQPAAVVTAAVVISSVLDLIDFVSWPLLRYRCDPNGGILAVIRFTDGNVEADHNPGHIEEAKTIFFTEAKRLDLLWILSKTFGFIACIVLSRYQQWSFALVVAIHKTLSNVSLGTQQVGLIF